MIEPRLITLPQFTVSGIKTWISGQHNEEFFDFWQSCNENGISKN